MNRPIPRLVFIPAHLVVLLAALAGSNALGATDDYQLGPDSMRVANAPVGRIEPFTFTNSTVYPGTRRDCWVYIPAQYDPAKPAALMVFQDGGAYVGTNGQVRATIVFDNLIQRGEMPVTIGLFVNPGQRGEDTPPGAAASPRSNRSFEYDSLGDAYAKFLIDELIPDVIRRFDLRITSDPELRAICGMSSGGICAFTVAWERPDYFRKVLSHIGSFTNIRGGHVYPALIRKTERKPIRIFLQDGANDLNNLHGDWPLANQEMASALRFTGYDVRFEFGTGAHSAKHGGAIFPESLRWLWRPNTAAPDPLTKDNLRGDDALSKVLPKEGTWEQVGSGYGFTDAACSDMQGRFYFSDLPKGTLYQVDQDGTPRPWLEKGPKVSGMKFGPDGRLYAATQGTVEGGKEKLIVAIDPSSKEIVTVATDVQPNDLVVSKAGMIYFTDTGAGQVMMVPTSSKSLARPRVATGGINKPNGIGLTGDHRFLIVSEYGGTSVWTYAIAEDGSLRWGERYMNLRTPVDRADSGGDGMTLDAANRAYVTSLVGIQMFDATGRLGGVIAKPSQKPCVSVGIAGADQGWLYACAGDAVWRRALLKGQ